MSDANGNKGMSFAIAEKRQGNNGGGGGGGGGCVGILFQLFDWHRRFAKKKIFKRRLFPSPARAKQGVQKFKGIEKMPAAKLNLIADDKKRGFPSMRKNGSRNLNAEQEHGTQAPGLVARLMGLESMPLVQQKPRKNFQCDAKQEKLVTGGRVVGKEDLNAEKGQTKPESRSLKVQKRVELDRRVVTQFGAEAFQIKNVLTRSRKHNRQKLLTPVKGPRITPSSSMCQKSSRLIDAATKILEPGLQNKNRTKCDLPYSSFVQKASVDTLTRRSPFFLPDMQRQNLGSECLANKPYTEQSSCKNCANLLECMDYGQNVLEQTFNHFDIAPQPLDDLYHKSEVVRGRPPSIGYSQAEHHNDRQVKDVKPCKEYRDDWPLSRHKRNPRRDEMPVQERTMPGSSYTKGDKEFVTLNQSISGRNRLRSPAKADSSRADVEGTWTRRSGSTSGMKPPLQKIRRSGEGNRSVSIENNNGVVSFTFHSPIRDKARFSDEEKNNKRGQNGFNENKSSESKSGLGENYPPLLQQKHLASTGDALGAILEEKLKELTTQEEVEDVISCKMPRRPTTEILQEPIAAVTAEPSVLEYGAIADSKTAFQMKPSICDAPEVFPDVNSFSPGSVLEASFSNYSCVSSSLDDVSGSRIHADLMDYSIDSLPTLVQDMELLVSATSSNMGSTHLVELTSLIDRLAGIMDSLILADVRLAGGKANLTKDIILQAELVFASFCLENLKCLEGVICALLGDVCRELKRLFSLGDAKVGSEMRAFALDCLLECFDEGYRRCCNIGYKGWERQLSTWSPEMLSRDIVEKVQRWASLSGLTPDEIIENEMSLSLGKWTEFDIEAFELGAAFADDVLEDVVEEIAVSILCPTR